MSSQHSTEEAIENCAPAAARIEESFAPPFSFRDSPIIGIDLSVLLPGTHNGGAKLLALEIARTLPRMARQDRFVILTGAACHDELIDVEGENVRRWLLPDDASLWQSILLDLPPMRYLLCPMTVPTWVDPRVPTISVVHDLQHLTYPDFFSEEELADRARIYRVVRDSAEHVLTATEYVRSSLIEHLGMPANRITAFPYGRSNRFPGLSDLEVKEVLWKNGLEPGNFLLFPANPWPHKNHHLLLTAFAIFLDRHRDCGVHLVLTGSADPESSPLARTIETSGLSDHVLMMGFVAESVLEALLRSCLSLVFPSLYEGFGLPVVEAMSFGRPVLASDCSGLSETTGGAALLFDPRKPEELANAMEQVVFDPSLAEELGRRGRERAAEIGDIDGMCRRYLEHMSQLFTTGIRRRNALSGAWDDGWTGRHLVVVSADSVEVELELSNWRTEPVNVTWSLGADRQASSFATGETRSLHFDLNAQSQIFHLVVEQTFCPAEAERNGDGRHLGLYLASATFRTADGRERTLEEFCGHH